MINPIIKIFFRLKLSDHFPAGSKKIAEVSRKTVGIRLVETADRFRNSPISGRAIFTAEEENAVKNEDMDIIQRVRLPREEI